MDNEHSVGAALLLFAALFDKGALHGEYTNRCVNAATLCICQAPGSRVSAAGFAVLVAGLGLRHRCSPDPADSTGDGEIGSASGAELIDPVSTTALQAAASSRVLLAIESLLDFRESHDARDEDAARCRHSSASCRAVSGRQLSGEARIDGDGFGFPSPGALDALATLLAHVIEMPPGLEGCPTVTVQSSQHRLWRPLCELLGRGGFGELSPSGLTFALRYAKGVVTTTPAADTVGRLLRGSGGYGKDSGLIGVVCAGVLGRRHLQAVIEWPVHEHGGGVVGASAIVSATAGLLQAVLVSDFSREDFLRVQQAMYSQELVAALLEATGELSQYVCAIKSVGIKTEGGEEAMEAADRVKGTSDVTQSSGEAEGAICGCVDLLARLVILSPHFSAQFIERGGLAILVSAGALLATSPASLVAGALVIASQLARASVTNYAQLRKAGVDASLTALLHHADPAVRAKACNLVGNLCRHSAFFYGALQGGRGPPSEPVVDDEWRRNSNKAAISDGHNDSGWRHQEPDEYVWPAESEELPSLRGGREPARSQKQKKGRNKNAISCLVSLCADPDPLARKFACFAVGNAAFHSDALYASLADAVGPLIVALGDSEEKTRANAAGALGNLVRNGGALSRDVAGTGGVGALLDVATWDPAAQPRRIALYSLGTCCAYTPCREALAMLEFPGGAWPDRKCMPRNRWEGSGDEGAYPRRQPVGGWDMTSLTQANPRLGRRLAELERAWVGDEGALKYVARLRSKLSKPPQA